MPGRLRRIASPIRRPVPEPIHSMRALCSLLALVLAPAALFAQRGGPPSTAEKGGTIRGTVVSSETLQPLPSVSISVRSVADSAVVGGELTGASGRFQVAGLPPGRYRVQANLLGHAPFRGGEVVIGPGRLTADLDTIRLRVMAISVQGVVAQGERSSVVVAPDRTIYGTQDMPVAAGGIATDVLRSVPEIEVDVEGNVSMRGSGVQIYLNGRPAPMEGESLTQFLEQFPADRIDRVEVIPNPSARFGAEGAAGIVNIVLKRNTDLGLSGSLFVNGGTRGDAGGGGRLTYQRGALTLFGGSSFRFSRRDNTRYDLRQNLLADPITFLEQDGWTERLGSSANADLTAELKLGERATAWAEGRLFRRGSDSDGVTAYTHMDALRLATERYDRASDEASSSLSADLAAGFRHVIEPQRRELELELRYDGGGDLQDDRVRRLFLSPEGGDVGLPVELTLEEERSDESELSAELDYVHPWGEKGQIEVGYRGDLESNDTERLLEVFADASAPSPLSSLNRDFVHRETFNSAYLTLVRQVGKLGIQAGVRAERAETNLEVPSIGSSFDNDYGSIFPNANLSYDLDDARRVRLFYSKRIRRPRESFLNPINTSTDPLNRRIGNPDLRPQYNHNFGAEASWTASMGTFRISPYYRRTTDDWTQITAVDGAGVSTLTWENLSSVESYGTSLTASLRQVAGTSGFVSVSGSREVRDASNLSGDYSGASMRWMARGNLSRRITEALSLQGMVYYSPAREVAQGRVSSSLMTHFGLRQQFRDGKASLNLTVTDPFDLYSSSFETRDRSVVQTGSNRFSMRSATLSFSYSFGRPPRDRRSRGSEEDETAEELPTDGIIRR